MTSRECYMGNCHHSKTNVNLGFASVDSGFSGWHFPCYTIVQSIFILYLVYIIYYKQQRRGDLEKLIIFTPWLTMPSPSTRTLPRGSWNLQFCRLLWSSVLKYDNEIYLLAEVDAYETEILSWEWIKHCSEININCT